jgi:hypothetical protein
MRGDNAVGVDGVNRLIEEGILTERALEAMTLIDAVRLRAALSDGPGMQVPTASRERVLTNDETRRLSVLAAQLTEGLTIDDDDRLKGIIESLTSDVHLSVDSVAQLLDASPADLESVLADPRSVPADAKYSLAIRCSYLMNAVNSARSR